MNLVQFSHGTLVSADDMSIRVNTPLPDYRPNPDDLVNPFSGAADGADSPLVESHESDENAQQVTGSAAQPDGTAQAAGENAPPADTAAVEAAKAMEPVAVPTGTKKSGKN